jgi:NAD(P)-dependent dehydrogenase (short-subunit alcohol dehydrogenase family)
VLEDAAEVLGSNATFEAFDITQIDDTEEFIDRVSSRVGPISILVNNAGIHLKKPATQTTPAEFDAVLRTHVVAAFALTRAVLPDMIERKHGNILFTASMASLFGIPMVVAYAAAKSAYLGMVRSLASEVSPHGVRVNAVAPGWIESEMMRNALNGDHARSNNAGRRWPGGDVSLFTGRAICHRSRSAGRWRSKRRLLRPSRRILAARLAAGINGHAFSRFVRSQFFMKKLSGGPR